MLEAAQSLYAGLPADFTPARTALEKEAKAAGDKELAAALKALRKPSIGAWAVNLLVRRESAQIDQVLEMAASLRAAAESLDGTELRALTKQRRQLTTALTTRARQLALESGTRLTAQVAEQVEGTLTAAMLDPAAADAVRTGLLVTTISSTGLSDEASYGEAVALPEALGTRPAPVAEESVGLRVVPQSDQVRREAAQDRVDGAARDLARAEKAAAKAQKKHEDVSGRGFQLRSEIDELQRRLAALEDEVESTEELLETVVEEKDEADAALEEARAVHDEAQRALDALP